MSTTRDVLASNLARVEERVAAACERAGRPRDAVKLIAVTKTVDVEVVAHMIDLGLRDFGESRPQELWRKAPLLPTDVRWHLIGHMQRNKVERTLPLAQCIHSVDSVRLLEALDAVEIGRSVQALLEVNCSGEASKHGLAPNEVGSFVPMLGRLRRVNVVGLMTMAALEDDPERCRPTFAQLCRLRDLSPAFTELSMGMSNDFEVAIEEGATMVRLGTVLFEGISG